MTRFRLIGPKVAQVSDLRRSRTMNRLAYKQSYRRHLPHIQPPNATLFITFRLAGSLPVRVSQRLAAEADKQEARLRQIADPYQRSAESYRVYRHIFGLWDRALEAAPGPRWLQDPRLADLVSNSLHHYDGKRYDLIAFCVMPNHVHTVFTPLPKSESDYWSMASILHSIKLYTARRANRILGREGQFWQHENYDHVVRGEPELNRIVRYVLNNPVKAGLVESWDEWAWSYCKWYSAK